METFLQVSFLFLRPQEEQRNCATWSVFGNRRATKMPSHDQNSPTTDRHQRSVKWAEKNPCPWTSEIDSNFHKKTSWKGYTDTSNCRHQVCFLICQLFRNTLQENTFSPLPGFFLGIWSLPVYLSHQIIENFIHINL